MGKDIFEISTQAYFFYILKYGILYVLNYARLQTFFKKEPVY